MLTRDFFKICLFVGMEHYLSLVVRICATHLGEPHLDHSKPTQKYAKIFPFSGGLCRVSPSCYLSLWHELNRR